MPAFSHTARPHAQKFFIVTRYFHCADGALGCQIPDRCAFASDPSASGCRITEHHRRHRKTGPGFPLVVARCATHGKAFTLYPPGYGPYLRKPVVDLAPDGTAPLGPADRPLHPFEGTLFDAALDAADGRAWARDSHDADPLPDRWWSTQGRHLDFTLRLLGLAREIPSALRVLLAAVLSVQLVVLRELATQVAGAPGYRTRGKAIVTVLAALEARRDLALRLLHCAYLIGHVGTPLLWDASRQCLERLPFRAPERPPPDLPA